MPDCRPLVHLEALPLHPPLVRCVWLAPTRRRPTGTRKRDVSVDVQPQHLTLRLGWAGRVLDGPLAKRVRASEALWVLQQEEDRGRAGGGNGASQGRRQEAKEAQGGGSGGSTVPAGRRLRRGAAVVLQLVLPKAEEGRYWRALFEGGEEKSHIEVSSHGPRACLWQCGPVAGLVRRAGQ